MIDSKYNIDYSGLPEDLQGSFVRYIEYRIPTGDFLAAVLSNDLFDAFGRADHINRFRIYDIVNWIYNEAPTACWGSRDKVETWLKGNEEN